MRAARLMARVRVECGNARMEGKEVQVLELCDADVEAIEAWGESVGLTATAPTGEMRLDGLLCLPVPGDFSYAIVCIPGIGILMRERRQLGPPG